MEENRSSAEMPKYKCHKEVWALKIKEIELSKVDENQYIITPEETHFSTFNVSKEWLDKHNPEVGGYYVLYKDGYRSYSPADAFEEGYTKID